MKDEKYYFSSFIFWNKTLGKPSVALLENPGFLSIGLL